MPPDQTQQQSHSELARAKDLSLRGTRPPVELPAYQADQLIGQGAFGEVWAGTDRNTGRRIAIKFYTQHSRLDWTHLSSEVEKLVFLSADRYVVQLLEVGWDSTPPYYVMEYIEGGSLEDMLREHGSVPPSEALEIFREVATGLIHAHGKGILHCDLKPANILLDEDLRPRLADFGQSRLSHEQSPALGTLFYMAPEQAELDAVPDARWDVYAIGAILYCLLTGSPPYRSQAVVDDLDQADGLVERLARYRRILHAASAPTAHRRVKGVDRALAEIIDRCLAIDPARRFPNVQSVIDAVQRRDEARIRNPLVVLGFIGPIVLLVIMAIFGLRGYGRAMSEGESFISERAADTSKFAARLAAQAIEVEISDYFRAIQQEAHDPALHQVLLPILDSPVVTQLNEMNRKGEPIRELRAEFIGNLQRKKLNDYLDERLATYLTEQDAKLTSLLVVDRFGRMLAVAYDHSTPSRSIGWSFSHRTYFHGGPSDLSSPQQDDGVREYERMYDVEPIRNPHFSAAFRSTTSELWKVAISAPIFDAEQNVIGVLAFTLNVNDFAYLRNNNRGRQPFAVLIDGRGVILQHPHFDFLSQSQGGLAENYTDDFRASQEQLAALRSSKNNVLFAYHDPLSNAVGGSMYSGDWIAAIANVNLPNAVRGSDDLLVLVQERVEHATDPVHRLGTRLKREGLWALGGVSAVILVLWYIVLRMLSEPRSFLQRRLSGPSLPTAGQQLTTVDLGPRHTEAAGPREN